MVQKSAEVIVGAPRTEGPNRGRRRHAVEDSMRGEEAQAQATAAEGEQGERNSRRARLGAECASAATDGMGPEGSRLMDAVVERGNMRQALRRVRSNRGAPGVDGLTVTALLEHLKQHWPQIKQRLLEGAYVPQPVRAVDIAKPAGGVRTLGIPMMVSQSTPHS